MIKARHVAKPIFKEMAEKTPLCIVKGTRNTWWEVLMMTSPEWQGANSRILRIVTPEFFSPRDDPTVSLSISYRSLPCRWEMTLNLREETEAWERSHSATPFYPSTVNGGCLPDSPVPQAQRWGVCVLRTGPHGQSYWSCCEQGSEGNPAPTHPPSVSSTGTPAPRHHAPQRYGLGCLSQRRSTREDYFPSAAGGPSQSPIHCWKATAGKGKAGDYSRESQLNLELPKLESFPN